MSDLPPDLAERGWKIKSISNSNILVLVKLFSFSDDKQFLEFSQAVNSLENNLNHHGELSIYEGLDRVRYAVFTHEPEPQITERDFRLARQVET